MAFCFFALKFKLNMELEKKAIGGYFELELPIQKFPFPHEEGYIVNSGHGALQLIVMNLKKVSTIWIPYYTCDIVAKALSDIGISYKFYHINSDLKIQKLPTLGEDDFLIYTNYFGIMDDYANGLSKYYENHLIIDNAQALFAKPVDGCHNIYSPHKFVGIPDGGIAISPIQIQTKGICQSQSYNSCKHLLKRLDGNVNEGYKDFQTHSNMLRHIQLCWVSELTKKLLQSIDYEAIRVIRKRNFWHLHSKLKNTNQLSNLIGTENNVMFECPMIYPYYTEDLSLRKKLIDNNIFVAQYWPNVLDWCTPSDEEYKLCKHIIPLPIDQRYTKTDMDRIIQLIQF